jgi:hypothetical protein
MKNSESSGNSSSLSTWTRQKVTEKIYSKYENDQYIGFFTFFFDSCMNKFPSLISSLLLIPFVLYEAKSKRDCFYFPSSGRKKDLSLQLYILIQVEFEISFTDIQCWN